MPVPISTEVPLLEDENDKCESDEYHGHGSDEDVVGASTPQKNVRTSTKLNSMV